MRVTIDHKQFPHIIQNILRHADAHALNRLRATSSSFLQAVEAQFAKNVRHVLMAGHNFNEVIRKHENGQIDWGSMCISLTTPATLPGSGERFLPLLSDDNIKDLLHPSGKLKHLRARFAAIRVLDVVQFVHNRLVDLPKLVNSLNILRLVGEHQRSDFKLHCKHIMLVWDMTTPTPLAPFDLHGLTDIVVNYRLTERPKDAESFFPMFGMCCETKVVLNFENYKCQRILTHEETLSLARSLASIACSAGGVILVGIEQFSSLVPQGTETEMDPDLPKIAGLPLPLKNHAICVMLLSLMQEEPQSEAPVEEQYRNLISELSNACGRITVMSNQEYAKRIGGQQYADLTFAEYAVGWKEAVIAKLGKKVPKKKARQKKKAKKHGNKGA